MSQLEHLQENEYSVIRKCGLTMRLWRQHLMVLHILMHGMADISIQQKVSLMLQPHVQKMVMLAEHSVKYVTQ